MPDIPQKIFINAENDFKGGVWTLIRCDKRDIKFVSDASVERLKEALRAALPRCDFIVDRDIGKPCDGLAKWVGSFHRYYCDEHHKEQNWINEVAEQGIKALTETDSSQGEEK